MKHTLIVLAALAAVPAAATERPVCIDPHYGYQALYLNGHDIVVKQTLGRDHRPLRATTTCLGFDLRAATTIRVSADFRCLDRGDTVATSTIDGHHQRCRITHIAPYAAPAAQ